MTPHSQLLLSLPKNKIEPSNEKIINLGFQQDPLLTDLQCTAPYIPICFISNGKVVPVLEAWSNFIGCLQF